MKPVAGFNVNKGNINLNGRPKEPWTMSGIIKEALEEQNETGVPKKLIIIRKLLELASNGDIVAIKEVNQRVDGMPKQSNDITSNGKDIKTVLVEFLDGSKKDTDTN